MFTIPFKKSVSAEYTTTTVITTTKLTPVQPFDLTNSGTIQVKISLFDKSDCSIKETTTVKVTTKSSPNNTMKVRSPSNWNLLFRKRVGVVIYENKKIQKIVIKYLNSLNVEVKTNLCNFSSIRDYLSQHKEELNPYELDLVIMQYSEENYALAQELTDEKPLIRIVFVSKLNNEKVPSTLRQQFTLVYAPIKYHQIVKAATFRNERSRSGKKTRRSFYWTQQF